MTAQPQEQQQHQKQQACAAVGRLCFDKKGRSSGDADPAKEYKRLLFSRFTHQLFTCSRCDELQEKHVKEVLEEGKADHYVLNRAVCFGCTTENGALNRVDMSFFSKKYNKFKK